MPWTPITTSELDTILTDTIGTQFWYDIELFHIAHVLYETGLRITEVLDLSRWTDHSPTQIQIALAKSDNFRLIDKTSINAFFLNYINQGQYTMNRSNYRNVNYRLKQYLPKFKTNLNFLPTTSHIFRYRFIHNLRDLGYTAAQIQAVICHSSLSSTQRYMNESILKFTGP